MPQVIDRSATRASEAASAILSARETAVHAISGIADLLSDTRGAIGDLQNVLSGLLARIGWSDGGAEPIGAIDEKVAVLLEGLRQVSGALRDEQLDATCATLSAVTRDIVRGGLEFQMVAKLAAITVASLPMRSSELENYAITFDRITKNLSSVSQEVEAQVRRILAARTGAIADLGAAAADLSQVRKALEAEVHRAVVSGSRNLEQEIATAAGALKTCARVELGNLVEAIQFADAFSQRTEHIATALSLAETANEPRRRALRRVAVALMDDLIAGARDAAAGLRGSIARLGEEGEGARAVLEAKLENGDLEAALSARETSLSRAAASVSQVAPRIDAIERRTHEIGRLAADAKGSLGDLIGISGEIKISSINAGFIASRISSSGGPLSVLTTATQEQGQACSQRIERCSSGIYALSGAIEALNLERLRVELGAVTNTAADLQKDATDAVGATSSLGAVAPRIASVLEVLDHIGTEVARKLGDVETALAAFDSAISQVRSTRELDSADFDPDDLKDLWEIYTMKRERDVHNLALGVEPQVEAASEQDALDDILF